MLESIIEKDDLGPLIYRLFCKKRPIFPYVNFRIRKSSLQEHGLIGKSAIPSRKNRYSPIGKCLRERQNKRCFSRSSSDEIADTDNGTRNEMRCEPFFVIEFVSQKDNGRKDPAKRGEKPSPSFNERAPQQEHVVSHKKDRILLVQSRREWLPCELLGSDLKKESLKQSIPDHKALSFSLPFSQGK